MSLKHRTLPQAVVAQELVSKNSPLKVCKKKQPAKTNTKFSKFQESYGGFKMTIR